MNQPTELLQANMADPWLSQWLLKSWVALPTMTLFWALSAMAMFWALTLIFASFTNPYRQRLNQMQQVDAEHDSLEQQLVTARNAGARMGVFSGHRIRTLLVHAGFHKHLAYQVFNGIRLLCVLCFVLGGLVLMLLLTSLPFIIILLLLMVLAYVAYMLPVFVLERLANKRMTRMKLAMPDALDLLVVCTEAGMGFKAALQRVAKEIGLNHFALSEELDLISAKIRTGLSIKQAFDEFILRTGLEDFRNLSVAINQSMQLGTSIAETLRTYADEYRIKRKQEAEEMAAKIGTKMIFPLVLCIWPSFFIVAIGPALIKVFQTFGGG
ncbi:hypothetical protein CBP31_14270 [Oceanisphaera profunda]|uniref:Type II secretion system protein GspF domain-containing protein n=1 Tax=Oceanisphaera profunda TaxID=1416627 RepID=A0A1Y0D7X0_9GAMM|nr:type II secretion system F family protein [Oceanisphaera profunda]ART83653.1 hypothetical protein CBP31_14270 [Oceanisphaera profunda]